MPEPEPEKRRNVLLRLAAEGMIPALGGAAGAAVEGPVGGVAGVAVGKAVEKAINVFGQGIVGRWQRWFAAHPADARQAVAELAATPPADARAEARDIVLELAPDADESDLAFALDYLSALPSAVDRALVHDPAAPGGRSVPPTVALDDPRSLLQLLPDDVPPYRPSAPLPDTPYRLGELLGAGGFGAVYRAYSATLQHLPLAIKFCLDRNLLPALNQERSNLERLMRAGGRGSDHVVRLYGYDLDHPTPYLVYEYVEGGDLTKLLAARRAEQGGPPAPAEVLGWVTQIADGLAFAHRAGLVHRDLKPANVLVANGRREPAGAVGEDEPPAGSRRPFAEFDLKLADFGLGGVAAARAAARSRIGTTTIDYLSLADQASLFRGAGTPLYMSPEQRRGMPPDPRHDLYALGVVWYQLLVGDVSRELHHGWAKELAVRFGVPAGHVGLIERCVGWYDERPKDANELLPLLRAAALSPSPLEGEGGSRSKPGEGNTTVTSPPTPLPQGERGARTDTALAASQVTPVPSGLSDGRRRGLAAALARLSSAYADLDDSKRWGVNTTQALGFALGLLVGWLVGEFVYAVKIDAGYFPAAFRAPHFDWLSVVLGVAAGGAVWGEYVVVVRHRAQTTADDLRQKADGLVGEIAADFPAEVAAWGGRSVLKHPAAVRQLREELDPPATPAVAPTAALGADEVAADPTKKAVLVARLLDHDKALKGADDAVQGSWVGLGLLWWLAAPLTGFGAGAGLHHAFDPSFGPPGIGPVAGGVAAGLVVALLSWWAMAAVRRNGRGKAVASGDRLAADYPRLLDGWGGRRVLDGREMVAALVRTLDPASADRKGWAWWLGRAFGR